MGISKARTASKNAAKLMLNYVTLEIDNSTSIPPAIFLCLCEGRVLIYYTWDC